MHRLSPVGGLLLIVHAVGWVWRNAAGGLVRLSQCGPLPRWQARVARLPPALALPLFLIPEICSRCGWLAAAWFLLHGDARAAMLIYAGSKLVAGLAALWVFRACEPALMGIGWFRSLYCGSLAAAARISVRLRSSGLMARTARSCAGKKGVTRL